MGHGASPASSEEGKQGQWVSTDSLESGKQEAFQEEVIVTDYTPGLTLSDFHALPVTT